MADFSNKPIKIVEINQTETAKKKIANIAKNNDLDFELVYLIISFYWNYDERFREAIGWVNQKNIITDEEYNKRHEKIIGKLNLTDKSLDKNCVIEKIYGKINELDKGTINNNFLYGSQNKNYCYVSEYASYYYLTNATIEKLATLDWNGGKLTKDNIVEKIFLKIFRGGSVDRHDLKYLYSDLIIDLPYNEPANNVEDWAKEFTKDLEGKTLTELIKELRQYCKGDKYFLQTILESLSYSGKIEVKGHSVKNKFIPDYRNELSEHFYANEWAYPLRFWKKE